MSWTRTTADGDLVNVHTRLVGGPLERSAGLLDRIAEPGNPVWPSDRWPPLVLDDGLRVGSRGGHGPIRYAVTEASEREVTFGFTPGSGLGGHHTFRVEPVQDRGVRWTHELVVHRPRRLVRWFVVPLHDRLLEDLLDGAEAAGAGRALRRRRFPLRVRALRAAGRARAVRARARPHRPGRVPPVASDG